MHVFIKESYQAFIQTINFLDNILQGTLKTENSLISEEGTRILDNDEDRRKMEEAVEYLKKNNEHSKEVILSNEKRMLVSID